MTKLKINADCSIRVKGDLYCLTDLYKFMNMRSERSSPESWAHRMSFNLVRKGFFKKSYWGWDVTLRMYAESLTPGIARDVYKALGIPSPVRLDNRHSATFNDLHQSPRSTKMALEDLISATQPVYEETIRRVERRSPARRVQSSTRSSPSGSRNDSTVAQTLLVNSVLSSEPYHSRSADVGTCSSRHSSHSSHDYSSYDSGSSSSDSGGGSGCD